MKRTLAALTAVTLALGLSLAAVVAPASADDTTSPNPVASSSPASPDSTTPAPTPSSTPTTAPTTPTDTTSPAPVTPAPAIKSFTATTANVPAAKPYDIVLWQTATYNVKYPQTKVSVTPSDTITLPAVPTTCGTSYQEDVYVHSQAEAAWLASTTSLAGGDGAQDGKYLAAGGNGKAYTYVVNTVCPPPCIPDSSVSYTYSNNDANSGDITVPTVAGSSGQLCKPFYVTATSWKYTTNAVWPQTVDQVDHVNGTPVGGKNIQILKSGVYHYAAQITCGQGDIYASFTANDATLFPENDNLPGVGYLSNPGQPLAEFFLHQMGFTGPNPTYHQDSTDCWTPTPETGVPTTSTLTCAQGSSNTLTLPAVPGGVWTVSNGTGNSHYNATYPIGTGVTNWVPSNFNGTYTITLKDGSSTDGYSVTGTSTTWTPQNPRTLDCNTVVIPVKPDVSKIVKCGVDGSVTIPTTTGVNYYRGATLLTAGQVITGSGDVKITATPQSGYEFSTNPHDAETVSWTLHLGDEKTCDVTAVVGSCTADGSVSSVPVSVTLNNNSGSVSSSFEVTIEGTTYDQTFSVDAHSSKTVSIGSSTTAGEKVDVFVNDSTTPVVLTIDTFNGCVPITPTDPTSTPLSCTGSTTNLASITTDGNPNLVYTLTGPGQPVGGTVFPSLPATPTISGLASGDYTVSVVAKTGFLLQAASPKTFPIDVPLAAVNCVGTQQTPVVTSVAPTCQPNPETVKSAGFTAALAEVQGKITIPANDNMTFTISDGTTTTPVTAGDYIEPDGTYTVVATLTSTAIADGFTFGPSSDYTVSGDGKTATFKSIVFTSECGLPTLASWHSGATADPATCTVTGGESGTITVVHGSDLANPTNEDGKVTYTLVNNGNGHTTNLGASVTSVNVAPGSYTVKATPTDPADGLVGNTNVANEIDYPLTVAAPAGSCGDSLAFTGGTIAWFGFVLAGGMLFLGIAFLLIRRRGNRTAE